MSVNRRMGGQDVGCLSSRHFRLWYVNTVVSLDCGTSIQWAPQTVDCSRHRVPELYTTLYKGLPRLWCICIMGSWDCKMSIQQMPPIVVSPHNRILNNTKTPRVLA